MMSDLVHLKHLAPLNITDTKQFENLDRDRPDFNNKYLKILYFFRYEGVAGTLRKYFAHKQVQKRYLTFLFIKHNDFQYINISTQYQTKPENFVIKNEFLPYAGAELFPLQKDVDFYLTQFNQFDDTEGYELFGLKKSGSISLTPVQREFTQAHNEGLFIYGLGGYVKMFILHHFKKVPKIGCVDYKSEVADAFKKKYGFAHSFISATDSLPLLRKVRKPVAIIASYHSDHASIATAVFNANPATVIFIEKPPVVTLEDLTLLINLYNKGAELEIGFNRRFIPYSKYVWQKVANQPVIITCSIKEVVISRNHWYLWHNQGTRITGNVVHWFDLGTYWTRSTPIEINLLSNPDDEETSCISVLYKNGSILNLTASDKGNSLRGVQEKIEIRFGNETIFIDDFLSLTHIKSNGRVKKRYKLLRKKGHNEMYKNF
ncbi:MAG: hypothetical protein WKF70_05215, partial [Chitinophagaceae bacterium]